MKFDFKPYIGIYTVLGEPKRHKYRLTAPYPVLKRAWEILNRSTDTYVFAAKEIGRTEVEVCPNPGHENRPVFCSLVMAVYMATLEEQGKNFHEIIWSTDLEVLLEGIPGAIPVSFIGHKEVVVDKITLDEMKTMLHSFLLSETRALIKVIMSGLRDNEIDVAEIARLIRLSKTDIKSLRWKMTDLNYQDHIRSQRLEICESSLEALNLGLLNAQLINKKILQLIDEFKKTADWFYDLLTESPDTFGELSTEWGSVLSSGLTALESILDLVVSFDINELLIAREVIWENTPPK